MSPPVLLLDVMDTLVRDPFFDAVPAVFGMPLDAYWAVKDRDAYEAFEKGEIDEATYAATHFTDRRPCDLRAFRRYLSEHVRWIEGIPALLDDLVAAGVELHAVSNYGAHWQILDDRLGLSRWLAWTFVSARTGLRKPDPAVWQHVTEVLERPAHHLVFVDDREKNCASARAAGLTALRFVDAPRLRLDLVGLGLLPA